MTTEREITIREMIEYFSRCYMNAQAGGAAQRNFERYIKTLESLLKSNTGHWVCDPERLRHWYCSECGSAEGITHVFMKYCPECGARMENGDV